MPNHMPGSGRFVQTRMGTPDTSVYGVASWRGNSMQPHKTRPLLPGAFTGQGKGTWSLIENVPPGALAFPRGPKVSGRQGTVEVYINGGATDTLDILTLTNDVTATNMLTIAIDTAEVVVTLVDAEGSTVGVCTAASLPNVVDGRPSVIRVRWDSVNPLASGFHMDVLVDGRLAPSGDFGTLPVAGWTYLQPTQLIVPHAFDGEMWSFQAATKPV